CHPQTCLKEHSLRVFPQSTFARRGHGEPECKIVCNRDETTRSGLGFVSSNLDKARPLRYVLPIEPKNFFRAQTGKRSESQARRDFWSRMLKKRGHFIRHENLDGSALILPPFDALQ